MTDHEKIRAEAKQIMDQFMLALEKVEVEQEEYGTERAEQTSGEKPEAWPGFRERMFRNAPKKNSSYIIAEKKGW
ncbi:Asp-tRNA(Asn) amidotransferase GatCAB subunit C [Candidatus Woesearchaeota archaeon]|nr:Asp-tRNA(Asn) amidotransferase GatCAB subunit C [Candidatus Woesearchaeota archaeon]